MKKYLVSTKHGKELFSAKEFITFTSSFIAKDDNKRPEFEAIIEKAADNCVYLVSQIFNVEKITADQSRKDDKRRISAVDN